MKNSLLKTMILSLAFFSMPSRAMLRPCMKALVQQRDFLQECFLTLVFEATQQDPSKIKNVFFMTHQFDDYILSKRLMGLRQCGVPVHVLISHALANKTSLLLDELHASSVQVNVFNQKYDDKIVELRHNNVWGNDGYKVRSINILDQPNNGSFLVVQQKDESNGSLVLRSGLEVSVTRGHQQFNDIHKMISTIFRDEDKSKDFCP